MEVSGGLAHGGLTRVALIGKLELTGRDPLSNAGGAVGRARGTDIEIGGNCGGTIVGMERPKKATIDANTSLMAFSRSNTDLATLLRFNIPEGVGTAGLADGIDGALAAGKGIAGVEAAGILGRPGAVGTEAGILGPPG